MNKTVRLIVGIACSAALVTPSYARGFGGGFSRGGGGFDRGGFGGGGFDRGSFGGGGFDRAGGGGFDHAGYGGRYDHAGYGGGSYAGRSEGEAAFPRSDYGGGGFGSISGSRPATASNFSQFSGHNPSQLAADGGGFGSIAGHNNLSSQNFGNKANVGNSVNPTVNNYNHTYMSQGYHPSYNSSGYHNYGGYGGYHPYGGYGYHGYGYGYHGYGYGYHGGFYGYPGCWNAGLAEASMWTCMGVSSLTSFLGIAALSSANSKQASNNVTYEGDNVYINGMPAQQYYQQGQQLAQTSGGNSYPNQNGTPFNQQVAYNSGGYGQMPNAGSTTGANETWEPLGVYSLVEQGQSQSTMLFQLAINQQGIVRGNYVNQITNERAQIHGALDKSTQKISWSVGDNPDTIFDTTLSELMKEKSKVVVQFGPNNTQQMSLVREKAPAQNQSSTQTS